GFHNRPHECRKRRVSRIGRWNVLSALARGLALERLPKLSLDARDVIAILTGEPTAVAAAVRLSAASLA
ncbi:MAG: hypothetical protein ACI9OJ_005550, partial [Myxococcota bacterium]